MVCRTVHGKKKLIYLKTQLGEGGIPEIFKLLMVAKRLRPVP